MNNATESQRLYEEALPIRCISVAETLELTLLLRTLLSILFNGRRSYTPCTFSILLET